MNEKGMMIAHEQYKLQWMIDHGYTLTDLMRELDKEREDNPEVSIQLLFEDWEYNHGFGGELWECFDEFCDGF